jgi:hypothetical protein
MENVPKLNDYVTDKVASSIILRLPSVTVSSSVNARTFNSPNKTWQMQNVAGLQRYFFGENNFLRFFRPLVGSVHCLNFQICLRFNLENIWTAGVIMPIIPHMGISPFTPADEC